MTWLVRDGDVLATAEVADSAKARRTGLLGRDDLDGALVIRPCRNVHTLGMRFAIDVAFCDASGRVLHTSTLAPWRISPRRAALRVRRGGPRRFVRPLGPAPG